MLTFFLGVATGVLGLLAWAAWSMYSTTFR